MRLGRIIIISIVIIFIVIIVIVVPTTARRTRFPTTIGISVFRRGYYLGCEAVFFLSLSLSTPVKRDRIRLTGLKTYNDIRNVLRTSARHFETFETLRRGPVEMSRRLPRSPV